ncbi:hypothetical protein TOPH_03006 [Tolypocladium ophioglossoides CBS 100239]|uniref:Uncharacterized protein n=1 Tax=Tolypocladium ophioglossoides (strain CBS 100239) TaxID=1163406 RepID=A0A0L0NEI0_TOLOC|nr:hypothetical protein TOPH_03006 [Tolypocladium ophioglossoides CBS 100239]
MTARVIAPPPAPPNGLGKVTLQTVEKPLSSGSTLSSGETSPCNAPTTEETSTCNAQTTRLRHKTSKSHDQLRQDSSRSSPTMATFNAIFRPRPYEEIYTEQAYLATSLQVQSNKATGLIRRYSDVEIDLETMEASKQRRRLRKQLNLLRSQINVAVEQEKAIFLRLSELYMEAHSRDTLGQAQQQRASSRERRGTAESSSGSSTTTFGSPTCSTSTPLNGATPEFVPKSPELELRADVQIAHEPLARAPPSPPPSASKSASPALDTVDESSEDFASNHGLNYQYKTGEKMEEKEECSHLRIPRCGDLAKCRENRLSLPSLESLWPN